MIDNLVGELLEALPVLLLVFFLASIVLLTAVVSCAATSDSAVFVVTCPSIAATAHLLRRQGPSGIALSRARAAG